jgi:hypothetical protein
VYGGRSRAYVLPGGARGSHDVTDRIAAVDDVGYELLCEDLDGDGVPDLLWTESMPGDSEHLGVVWLRTPGLYDTARLEAVLVSGAEAMFSR